MNKQLWIYRYISEKGSASISELVRDAPWGYYHNGNRYMSMICSRMVKNGTLVRIKRGVFAVNNHPVKRKPIKEDPRQLKLFTDK